MLLQTPKGPVVKKATFPEDYPAPFGCEDFHVLVMSAGQKSRFEGQFVRGNGKPDQRKALQMRERLAVATFCDESGELLLREADVASLAQQDGRIVGYIAETAATANKIDEVELESIAKN